MHKFDITISSDMTINVPDEWILEMKAAASAPDATAFLKATAEQAGDDEDEFTLAVITNGVRKYIRDGLLKLMHDSGLGGSFSPTRVAGQGSEIDSVEAKPEGCTRIQLLLPAPPELLLLLK